MSSLQDAMNNGFINKIIIDGMFAGIFAVERTFLIFAAVLYKRRNIQGILGKNFAAAAQRKMIDSLEASGNDFIFGTIVPENHTSLNTAYKSGRKNAGNII